MKKIAIILLTALTSIILSSCGLGLEDLWPEYEDTYFRYASRSGSDTGVFIGFTELGLEQNHLVLPSHINGLRMRGIGYERSTLMYSVETSYFEHENLEKLYVDIGDCQDTNSISWSTGSGRLPNTYIVIWKSQTIPRIIRGTSKGLVISFSLYHIIEEHAKKNSVMYVDDRLANVSYMYNYEDAPTKGYYWVDSYDNAVVDFIPPEPTREGYTFDGWYKEKELVNKWNFEEDKTGPELVITETVSEFNQNDITFLYAKWIQLF